MCIYSIAPGAVANLVAKKFIDYKHNDSNIYCYTYQAPNTINRNNLTSKIHNTKYASIFNVENTDDIMLNLVGDDAGWAKYGVKKYLSVGDNDKTKKSWNRLTHDSYKSGSNFLNNLFGNIFDFFRGVFGFSSTYIPTDELDSLELARAIYAERMREESPSMRQAILDTYRNEPQYLIKASEIDFNSKVADLQATDFTAVDSAMINELSTMLQPIIDKKIKDSIQEKTRDAVEKMMKWYTEHIATYYRKHDNKWKDKQNGEHTLYGSEEAEKYYTDNDIENFTANEKKLDGIVRKHDSGRYVYYCDAIDKVSGHPWVGDDCTGFLTAVYQLYAGEKLKNNPKDEFNVNTINKINTSDFSSSSESWASKFLRKNAGIYTYKVTSKTTLDDLDFGDILICGNDSSKHAEMYLDDTHAWGWGMKHCSYEQDGNIGWKGTWTKSTISDRDCFIIKDRSVFVRDEEGNETEYIKSDNRAYNIVLSTNPKKNQDNIESLFVN